MKYYGIFYKSVKLIIIILLLFSPEYHSAKAKLKQTVKVDLT